MTGGSDELRIKELEVDRCAGFADAEKTRRASRPATDGSRRATITTITRTFMITIMGTAITMRITIIITSTIMTTSKAMTTANPAS